jgi:hypothetical protein
MFFRRQWTRLNRKTNGRIWGTWTSTLWLNSGPGLKRRTGLPLNRLRSSVSCVLVLLLQWSQQTIAARGLLFMGNVPPNNADFLNFPYASIRSSSRQVRSSEQTFSTLVGSKRVMLYHKKLGIQFALSHHFQSKDCTKAVAVCLWVVLWLLRDLLKVNLIFKKKKNYHHRHHHHQ